ncbi:MAG: hypothetical protein WC738_03710 [Candidatus Omnitrophota bacterium]
MENRKAMTYRCSEDIYIRLEALKARGLSFQRIVDDLIHELLWKFQHETDMFKDLTNEKRAVYVVKDLLAQAPAYKRFFRFKA